MQNTIQMLDLPHQLHFSRGTSLLQRGQSPPMTLSTQDQPLSRLLGCLLSYAFPYTSAGPGLSLRVPLTLINSAVPVVKVFFLVPLPTYAKLSAFPFSHPLPFTPLTSFCTSFEI